MFTGRFATTHHRYILCHSNLLSYRVFIMFGGDIGLAMVKSKRGPAAAISGTAKQQSQSSVLASFTRRILSYGRRIPSHGPPGRKRFMYTPRSYNPSDTENPKSSYTGSLCSDTWTICCGLSEPLHSCGLTK